MTIRILSYNIKRGGTGREEALQRVISACAPDLVVLQEATSPIVVERVARGTGMSQSGCVSGQSLAFMSRIPIARHAWHRPRLSRHAFLEVVPAGAPFCVFGMHLSAVHAAWTEQRRVYELRALLRSVDQHKDRFHVLAGDFNTVAPGDPFAVSRLPMRYRPLMWLSGGSVRWRTIQTVLDAGYADTFKALHPHQPGLTLPASDPHIRLDYVFVPEGELTRVLACDVVKNPPAAEASDHLPVVADFRLDD